MSETDSAAPPRPSSGLLVVVMGVSGSGKSTVGQLVAERLGVEYADADDFHNPANIAKMAAGNPLDDDDRRPWLAAIGRWLAAHATQGAVVTCSALKRRYRDALREHAPDLCLLHLHGTPDLLTARVRDRPHHFMPPSLVQSQFDALELPEADEWVVTIDVAQPPDAVAEAFLVALGQPTADVQSDDTDPRSSDHEDTPGDNHES